MNDLESVKEYLFKCKRILFLTGPDISPLPNFDNPKSVWGEYSMIDLATPDAFHTNPDTVYKFYEYRRRLVKELMIKVRDSIENIQLPHSILAKLSNIDEIESLTITQNVDNLHLLFNHNKRRLLEFHGNIFEAKCTEFFCGFKFKLDTWDSNPMPVKCPCGGLLRPNIVWYGESVPLGVIDEADDFILDGVDLLVVVGTGMDVWPAATYVDLAREQGAKLLIINEQEKYIETDAIGTVWQVSGDNYVQLLNNVFTDLINK